MISEYNNRDVLFLVMLNTHTLREIPILSEASGTDNIIEITVLYLTSTVHDHLTCCDCNPIVLARVEPRQTETVLPVNIHVLTSGVPPSALIVACAVCVRDISIEINSREFHVVLVLKSVTCVSFESTQV